MRNKIFIALAFIFTLAISAAAFAAYERTADNTVPAYTDPELRNRNGNERVDAGDRLIVFEERGTALYVRYPTSNGTKDRWVSKGVFTETIGDGWYRIKPMHDLGHSADALGNQYRDGNNIHLWENIDCDQQKFYLQNRGNGYFSLQSGYGNRLFVTADGSGNGANLYTSNWNGSDSQLFRLVSGGNNSFHIFSKAGNAMNFDCAGGGSSNGTNLQLWQSENNNWHKWTLERVNGPANNGNSGSTQVSLNVDLLKQNDSRWGNEMIRTRTIAARGCTITSLAMVYNYHQHANITPTQMRDALKFDGNSVIWSSVRNLGFTTNIVDGRPYPDNTWLGKIYSQLKAGRPVIVGAYRDGDNQHWVVVKGYTGNSATNFNAADFQINDPMNPFTNLQQFFNKYNLGLRGIVY